MPNIAQLLKDEITRLARKEMKVAVTRLKADQVKLKAALAEQSRIAAELQKEVKQLQKAAGVQKPAAPPAGAEAAEELRMTAKGVRSLRLKLGLTQAEFGKLVGVSQVSIYQWEKKEGRLRFRGESKGKLLAVRDMTKKQARAALEQQAPPAKAPGA